MDTHAEGSSQSSSRTTPNTKSWRRRREITLISFQRNQDSSQIIKNFSRRSFFLFYFRQYLFRLPAYIFEKKIIKKMCPSTGLEPVYLFAGGRTVWSSGPLLLGREELHDKARFNFVFIAYTLLQIFTRDAFINKKEPENSDAGSNPAVGRSFTLFSRIRRPIDEINTILNKTKRLYRYTKNNV